MLDKFEFPYYNDVKGLVMDFDEDIPVYSIGVASKLLDVHPRTLRIYEAEGLVVPKRNGGKRFYSKSDLERIECLRVLIHEKNLSIPGIKKLLEYIPCWKLKSCTPEKRKKCRELSNKKRHCWEFKKCMCERSCENCEVYLEYQKSKSEENV